MTDFSPTGMADLLADRVREIETARHYKFDRTYCSQCGLTFGPGDHGFSHCKDHRKGSPSFRFNVRHGDRHSLFTEN